MPSGEHGWTRWLGPGASVTPSSPARINDIHPDCTPRFAHGEALKAEKDIPARDLVVAASCFVRALDLDPDNPLYGQKLADVASELNQAQLCGVLDAVYLARDGQAGQAATLLGMSSAPQGATHRCVASLRFPQVRAPPCRLHCAHN
jgi:hypothetical protein